MLSQLESTAGGDRGGIVVPDHELVRCIGRGSYGEVWLARNFMGAYRAVKIVYRKNFEHQRPFDRELAGIRKFEPISRSHEGFVDILHVGQNEKDGYFYYIMELGDDTRTGQTIDVKLYVPKTLGKQVASRGKLAWEECVQLGLSLTSALSFLHKSGLVHRDVKPSNIIFVNSVAKLADIGLVADISEARSYVGTEGFIPPEGPGTPQADVYGLGKVLYEISTGKDRHDFPELPTLLDGTADMDRFLELNEVILHACRNDVAQRYASAWDMHADLVVLANGKSVKRLKLLEKRLVRLKKVAGASAVAVVALAAILFQVYREWNFAREGRQRQVGAEVAYGTRALEEGDLLKSLPSFAAALRLDHSDIDREQTHRLRLRAVLEQTPKLVQMWFNDRMPQSAWFSPDGNRILIVERLGQARIFDIKTGQPVVAAFGQSAEGVSAGAWHPSGQAVVTASYDRTACAWDLGTGAQLFSVAHPDRVLGVACSPDGSRIATACKDGVARIWNSRTGKKEHELRGHSEPVLSAAFSHDSKLVVTTSRDGTARIWNAQTGKLLGLPLPHGSWVHCASFSPDDRKVVTGSSDHRASVWEVGSSRKILPDLKHVDAVMGAEFSPDGLMILTACMDGSARFWDAYTAQPVTLNPILWHSSRLLHAAFSTDGHRVVTTCDNATICVWDLAGSSATPAVLAGVMSNDGTRVLVTNKNAFRVLDTAAMQFGSTLIQVDLPVVKALFSPGGRFAVAVLDRAEGTSSPGRVVRVWDCSTGTCVSAPINLNNPDARVSLSQDGQRLLVFTDTDAQLWSVPDGKPVGPVIVPAHPVSGAALSGDGRRLAIFGGKEASLWDPSSGSRVGNPWQLPLAIKLAEFSPDSHTLVTACCDDQLNPGEARVWDSLTGKAVGPPVVQRDGILCAALCTDGRRILTAGEDFSAVVWDINSGRAISPPLRHREQVRAVAFSPNGKWVATAAADMTARVWDAVSGEPLTPPLLHPPGLQSVGFSADGARLVTADGSGRVWCWDLRPDARPIEDLLLEAQLLTGFQISNSKLLTPRTAQERRAVWQKLRSAYSNDFTTSRDEVFDWHSGCLQYSRSERRWPSAAFHLLRLVNLDPDDRALSEQLKEAQEHLSKEENR
jgi:WD40 repeat protein